MDLHHLTRTERKVERKRHLQPEFPTVYSISLGEWSCNLRCRMCPMFNEVPKVKRAITDEIMKRALSFVEDRPVRLEVSAWGETFQHPQADQYMFWCREMAPKAEVLFVTNGTLLNPERCEKIVDSGIDRLQFSLDAGSAETYEWLTGSKKYDQIVRNLETLVETRNKKNAKHLKIQTFILGIKELSHEFEPFLSKWRPLVDEVVVRRYGNWGGLVDGNGCTGMEEEKVPPVRYPCAWPFFATKIQPNGDVSKCFVGITGDNQPLGNIMEKDFKAIWSGEKMQGMRNAHKTGCFDGVDHCGTCTVWSLFPNFWKKEKKWGIVETGSWA